MIIDLEVVKDVLIRNFDNFHYRGIFYNEKNDPLTAHIFAIEDQAWKDMRTKLTPTFTSGKMKMMFTIVEEVSKHMIENLKKQVEHAHRIDLPNVGKFVWKISQTLGKNSLYLLFANLTNVNW